MIPGAKWVERIRAWTGGPGSGGRGRLLRALLLVLWLAGIGLMAWLVWANWPEIYPYLRAADLRWLAAAAVGYVLSIVAAILGWTLIMRPFAPQVSLAQHGRIYAVTLVARRLPGTLWYVGGRLILYGDLGISKTFVAIASAVEIVIFVVSGALLGAGFLPRFPNVGWLLAILFLGSALALWFSPDLITSFLRRRGLEPQSAARRTDLAGWLAAYSANWLSGGVMVAAIIAAFTPIGIGDLPYILGAWAFSGAVGTLTIFLPSTFGLVELSLAALLSRIMPLPLAVVIAVVTRLLTYLFDFLLASVLYPFVRRR